MATEQQLSCSAAGWVAGIGTLVLAFVAVFQQWLQQRFIRPRLRLRARVSRPDADKTRWAQVVDGVQRELADVYYFRLGVTNVGNASAHDVQVYLADIKRQRKDGNWEAVERFVPMNLLRAYGGKPTKEVLLPNMPPVFCDMAHIGDPRKKADTGENLPGVASTDAVLGLDLEVKPFSRGHLLEPGRYRFQVKLAAANHPPVDYKLEIDFPGTWFDDENRMFSDGFGIRLI